MIIYIRNLCDILYGILFNKRIVLVDERLGTLKGRVRKVISGEDGLSLILLCRFSIPKSSYFNFIILSIHVDNIKTSTMPYIIYSGARSHYRISSIEAFVNIPTHVKMMDSDYQLHGDNMFDLDRYHTLSRSDKFDMDRYIERIEYMERIGIELGHDLEAMMSYGRLETPPQPES